MELKELKRVKQNKEQRRTALSRTESKIENGMMKRTESIVRK
jgi:hypothetical protein